MRLRFASAALVFAMACYPKYLPTVEPIVRIEIEKRDYKHLTLPSFLALLKQKGVINMRVVSDTLASLDYVAVDGTNKLFVFYDRGFIKTVESFDRPLPARMRLHAVSFKGLRGIIAIPQGEGTNVAMYLLTVVSGDVTDTRVAGFPLDKIIREQRGILDPFVLGYHLEEGIIFTARDMEGRPWDKGYLLTVVGGKTALAPLSRLQFLQLSQCSCYGDWLEGKDARNTNTSFFDYSMF